MKAPVALIAAMVFGLVSTGCTSTLTSSPQEDTPVTESAHPIPDTAPTPGPRSTANAIHPPQGSSPSLHPSPDTPAPIAVPVVDLVTAASPEITRIDAYELCKEAALAYGPTDGDPRDVYLGIEQSDVGAVDGWWRVWIPGVTHPDGEPTNVALTCILNGYMDKPTFHSYGGVASDYYPDRDAYFDDLLKPYND